MYASYTWKVSPEPYCSSFPSPLLFSGNPQFYLIHWICANYSIFIISSIKYSNYFKNKRKIIRWSKLEIKFKYSKIKILRPGLIMWIHRVAIMNALFSLLELSNLSYFPFSNIIPMWMNNENQLDLHHDNIHILYCYSFLNYSKFLFQQTSILFPFFISFWF